MKYIKKPAMVEAFRYGYDEIPDWLTPKDYILHDYGNYISIVTPEDAMTSEKGTYIIKDVNNKIYPCEADIFHKTYEQINDI